MSGIAGPIWVPVRKAATFAEVKKVYKRAAQGQGAPLNNIGGPSGPSNNGGLSLVSAPRGFLETVRWFFQGPNPNGTETGGRNELPAWIRVRPGFTNQGWQDCQVDVTAIPGVRPLRDNGKWYNYTG